MKASRKRFEGLIPPAIIIIGLLVLTWWIMYDPTKDWLPSEPGRDGYTDAEALDEDINIGAFFERFSNREAVQSENWPRFRGPEADNRLSSDIPLIDHFGDQIPDIRWSVPLGEGHAGAAIYQGMVYVLDYDEELRADMLRCFSLYDGEEIWRRWYTVSVRRNHGMSRTVPAVTDHYVLTMGPRGHVMCLDRLSGDFLWGMDVAQAFKSEIPLWYTGQCPLIDNGVAVIATAGSSLMIGVDCATGEILWETPNPNNWQMSHASVMPFDFGGRRMYIYSAIGGVVGVVADGPDAGSVLWESSEWNHPVVAPSPLAMSDGKIFLSAGYGAGSMLLQLHAQNGAFRVEVLHRFRPGEGLSSEQQTPILVDGHLFGVMPKDARALRNQFVCTDPADPTNIIWASGPAARFGLGPYILADDKFYLLDDDATLYIIQKSIQGYVELDKAKLFDGHDAWGPLAIADGFMVLRDADQMICIDLRK